MTARDVDLITHRLDAITRAATRIRRHLADLHYHRQSPRNQNRPCPPRPRRSTSSPRLNGARATLVGLERQVLGYFMVTATSAEVTRGSLIRADEHARLLARQRARAADGEYVPERLVDQPPHPGKGRR